MRDRLMMARWAVAVTMLAACGGGGTDNNSAGPPALFTRNAGDGQSALVTAGFTQNLQVKVTDQDLNGVSQITVNWEVQSGSLVLGGASSVTNAQGVASIGVTAGATDGPALIRATTTSVAGTTLDFNLTVKPVRVVNAQDFFFQSVRNNSQGPAVDTIPVGGALRWVQVGGVHNVVPVGSPSFTGAANLTSPYTMIFNIAGTYQYDCGIHFTFMPGQVVVQ